MSETSASPDSHDKLGSTLPPLIAAAAFGPYLVSGVKTDQIVVYGFFVLLALQVARVRFPLPAWPIGAIMLGWSILIALGVVQLFAEPVSAFTRWGPGQWVANLDSFLLSLVTMVVVVAVVKDGATRRVALRRVAAVVTVAMCINAVIAVVSSQVEVPWASLWLSSSESGTTTATRAANMGRFVGLINQPAEAGILYGFAGMGALLWLRHRPFWLSAALLLLIVGGLAVVSKAFLFLGLPVVLWHFARQRGGRLGGFTLLVGGAVLAWVVVLSDFVQTWTGAEQLARQLPGAEAVDPVRVLTGNRYGAGQALSDVVGPLMELSPMFGYGMAGVGTATDAAWVRALVIAGLAGVFALGMAMVGMLGAYVTRKRFIVEGERRFYAGVIAIAVVSSFAFPTFTGNRVAVIFWLCLGLLLSVEAAPANNPRGPEVAMTGSRYGRSATAVSSRRLARRRVRRGGLIGTRPRPRRRPSRAPPQRHP